MPGLVWRIFVCRPQVWIPEIENYKKPVEVTVMKRLRGRGEWWWVVGVPGL